MFLIPDKPSGTALGRVRGQGRRTWRDVAAVPLRGVLAFIEPAELVAPLPSAPFSLDWAFKLLLYEAVIVWVMRGVAHTSPWQEYLFWGGLPLLFLPLAARAAWPGVASGERMFCLVVLAESTFLLKVLFRPVNFAQFDEFLHWLTASDILDSHRLFLPNSMLPISPLFPGLELVTTALVNLSGLSLFFAANLVVAVIRGMFIASLYGFYGRISGSYRMAALACLAYMGSSGFLMFDSQFAYETLAFGFLATILLAHAELAADAVDARRTITVMGLLLAGIALTHHITAIETLGLLAGIAILQALGGHARWRLHLTIAGLGAAFLLLWLYLIGNPLGGYLDPVLKAGGAQFLALLKGNFPGHSGGHKLKPFVALDGTRTPIWLQWEMFAAIPLIALLLANGFFTALAHARGAEMSRNAEDAGRAENAGRAEDAGRNHLWRVIPDLLRRRWERSWMLLIALLALTWPVSILLRLSAAGWQMGNRLSALAFIGVGLVLASSILRFWQRPNQWVAGIAACLALTLVFTSGVIGGWGLPATRIGFKVEGDSLSIEPMAVEAAEWTKIWLGIGSRVTSDRFNDIMLATYGRQEVVTQMYYRDDPGELFLEPVISGFDDEIVKTDRIEYLVADVRLTTGLPYLGPYYGEPSDPAPLDLQNFAKWDDVPGVSRVFDNGSIMIYDVRHMRYAP